MILEPSPENITDCASRLKLGELVAFPTETVYGLGADASNPTAVEKIFQVKGRPSSDPLIVHTDSIERILRLPETAAPRIRKAIEQLSIFWPGPLSVIVPKPSFIPLSVTAGLETMALRVPNHKVALELLKESGLWVAAPSANPFSYISPTRAMHVQESLGDRVSYILDGGPCSVGIESTVLSLVTERPTVLRPGAITVQQLSDALNERVDIRREAAISDAMESPGLSIKHYSPKTPIRSIQNLSSVVGEKIGLITFSGQDCIGPKYAAVSVLTKSDNLTEAAANLYDALREQDKLGLDCILIESCEASGLGEAIMDRIIRACAN